MEGFTISYFIPLSLIRVIHMTPRRNFLGYYEQEVLSFTSKP